MSESTAYQAGTAMIDGGITFEVPMFFGRKKKFTINPLKPGTIIRLSMIAEQLTPINKMNNMSQEVLANGKNLKLIATGIAYAIINREIFKRWKLPYYRWILLNRVENMVHLNSYWNLVYRQMSAEHFFFIMESTPAMNYLRKKEESTNKQVENLFGEQSDLSEKHSN